MKKIAFILFAALALMARAQDSLMDTNLARNAVAVVRARLIVASDGDARFPFKTYYIHTIRILKNDSHERFVDLDILAYKDRPGIPKEECTVYLQRYDVVKKEFSNDKDDGRWILVGGDATAGVSNVGANVGDE